MRFTAEAIMPNNYVLRPTCFALPFLCYYNPGIKLLEIPVQLLQFPIGRFQHMLYMHQVLLVCCHLAQIFRPLFDLQFLLDSSTNYFLLTLQFLLEPWIHEVHPIARLQEIDALNPVPKGRELEILCDSKTVSVQHINSILPLHLNYRRSQTKTLIPITNKF